MALHDHGRLLVCLRWGIGDLILQWPVLEALRSAAPDACITFLGARPAIQLLEGAGLADEVWRYQEFGMTHVGASDRAASRRFREWLEAQAFDAVADMLAAPPAARRVGWRPGAAYYESDRAASQAALRQGEDAARSHAAAAAEGWGLTGIRSGPPRLRVDERDEEVETVLDGRPVGPQGWAAIVPFASHALKRWPAERFAAVARALVARGHAVLVFAAPEDGSAERVREAAADEAVTVVPPLHLRTTAAVLARAALAVGNDTGLLHLAAAAGTPAVTVFGPSDARVYAPAGCRDLAARSDRPCRHRQDRSLSPPGCWTSDRCLIADSSCIDDVGVEAVLRRLDAARAGAAAAPRAAEAVHP